MSIEEDRLILRTQNLIALATQNSEQQEARTAAVQACLNIVNGKLKIVGANYTAPAAAKGRKAASGMPVAKPRKPGGPFHKHDVEWVSVFATRPTVCPFCSKAVEVDVRAMSAFGFGRYHQRCWDRISPHSLVIPINREVAERYYSKRSVEKAAEEGESK